MEQIDIAECVPRRIARPAHMKRKSVTLREDDHVKLVKFARDVNLSIPVAIMTLLNIAERAGIK